MSELETRLEKVILTQRGDLGGVVKMRRVGPGRRLQTQNDTQDTDAHQGRSISGGFREAKVVLCP